MVSYKTEFSDSELKNALHKQEDKAKEIIENYDKWEKFQKEFEKFLLKAKKTPILGSILNDVVCMVEIIEAYIAKEYTDIPFPTIISIVSAVLYVISPIDIIPDFIPVVGYMDDVAVVMLVLRLGVAKDIKKFRKWKNKRIDAQIKRMQQGIAEEVKRCIKDLLISAVIYKEEGVLEFLLTKDEIRIDAIECVVYTMCIPQSILSKFDFDSREDIMEFMEQGLVQKEELWDKRAVRKIFFEPDFEDQWDNYVILEGKN